MKAQFGSVKVPSVVGKIDQDTIRRKLLREHDIERVNIALLDQVARFSLDHGYDVVVEGILAAERYGAMLTRLYDDHRGTTAFYFFDVSLEETLLLSG